MLKKKIWSRNWRVPYRVGVFFNFVMLPDCLSSTRGSTKFGYRSEKKIEIFMNPTKFWRLIGTYYCHMRNSCIFPQNLVDFANSFFKKSFIWAVALVCFPSPCGENTLAPCAREYILLLPLQYSSLIIACHSTYILKKSVVFTFHCEGSNFSGTILP